MKQVIQYYQDGRISLEQVPEPFCKAGGVKVRLVASLISAGRVLGESCHFDDFSHYLAESRAVAVNVQTISGDLEKYRSDDNLILTLTFADGSLGAIMHTAKGPKAFSRKRIEVFWEEAVAVIEGFPRAQVLRGHRRRTWRKLSQYLKCQGELAALSQASWDEPQSRRIFLDYLASSRTTLKAAEYLRTGRPMMIGS